MDREIPQNEIQRRRRLTYIKIVGIVVAVIIVIFILAMSLQKTVKRSDITISDVTVGLIEATVNAQGEVVPSFEEIINSPISTRIVEVYKHEGDTVGVGTPLLLLDLQSASTQIEKLLDERQMKHYELEQTRLNNHTYLSNLEMQIRVKEMDVNRKLVEVENERRLDSLGSGTGDRVRQAELAYNTGCLELSQLRQQLTNERSVRDASYRMKELEMSIFDKNLQEQRRIFEDAQIRSPRAATLTY
ncbi:MAG: efflux RND transporter periplasmic adaptor subunit, partial [Muribaculaceae bacterium]|nr:efflux RND transporter periplasmic adaptor subunit [Muribaculaceae bacterium]